MSLADSLMRHGSSCEVCCELPAGNDALGLRAVTGLRCLSKLEPTAPEAWASWLACGPSLLMTQGAQATPLPDCQQARPAGKHVPTPGSDPAYSKPRQNAHLSPVCAFGQEVNVARTPREEQSTPDSDPSASQPGEFALGVTDPLTKGISVPSRWRGQGGQWLVPRRATIQVLAESLWPSHPSAWFIFLCSICFLKDLKN